MTFIPLLFVACLIPLVVSECEVVPCVELCPLGHVYDDDDCLTSSCDANMCLDEHQADPECTRCADVDPSCLPPTKNCRCGLRTDDNYCPIESCECEEDCFPVVSPCTDICPEADTLEDCEFGVDTDVSSCPSSRPTCRCRKHPCHNIICPSFTYCAREGHRPVCTGPCMPMSCTITYLDCPFGLNGTGSSCKCECADDPCDPNPCPSGLTCCLKPLSPIPYTLANLHKTMRRLRCVAGACPWPQL